MSNQSQINKVNPSICVPRVFNNITKERVFRIFAQLFGGENIDRIDMVSKLNKDGQPIKRVFVHFKPAAWDRQPDMRTSLVSGKEVKIVYDDPWFWKCLANTGTKRDSSDGRKQSAAPRVEIGGAAADIELPKPRESTMTDVSARTQPSKADKKGKKKRKMSFEEYDKKNSTPADLKASAQAEVTEELQRVASSTTFDSDSSSDSDEDEDTAGK